MGLALGWLLTLLGIWFVKSQKPMLQTAEITPNKAAKPESVGAIQAIKSLKKACEAGDRMAAREALKVFGDERWPSLDAEGRHAALKHLLGEDLDTLDRAVYGQAESTWDGQGFLKRLETRIIEESNEPMRPASDLLESLYKS
jgi:hypothetical protein